MELLQAALSRARTPRRAVPRRRPKEPLAAQIEYRDGPARLDADAGRKAGEFLFARGEKGAAEPDATLFWLQEPKPFAHFARLDAATPEDVPDAPAHLPGGADPPDHRHPAPHAPNPAPAAGERLETPELSVPTMSEGSTAGAAEGAETM